MLKTRSIKFQHECLGLAHHSGNVYITTDTYLHVYNISSGRGRKLYSDKSGEYTVHRCAVSPDSSRVYITNYTNHQLITLNTNNGSKLSTLTHPELQNLCGIHVTSLEHLFECCYVLNTVVQVVVKKDGTHSVAPLAGTKERIIIPQPVCFNRSTNTIVVGQLKNDTIVELQLKR